MVKARDSIRARYLVLAGAGMAAAVSVASAFDTSRPEVEQAYLGAATIAKRQIALEGVDELLTVASEFDEDDATTGVFIETSATSYPVIPTAPAITIDRTINAGSHLELIVFEDPVAVDLSRTLLNITGSFSSSTRFVVGADGGIIDTNDFNFAIGGNVETNGVLLKRGTGSLRISGTTQWNVPPVIQEGTLVGRTFELDTPIDTLGSRFVPPAATIQFDQDGDGNHDHAVLNPANLLKTRDGTVTLTVESNLGSGSTTVEGGTLAFSGDAAPGAGPLHVSAGSELDLRLRTPHSFSIVGTLTGAGDILIRNSALATFTDIDSTFDGRIFGSGTDGSFWFASSSDSVLTLTNGNAADRPVNIFSGTIALSGSGDFKPGVVVNFLDGSLDISAADGDREVAMLNEGLIAGFPSDLSELHLGANSLYLGRFDQNGGFGGRIIGSGDLVKLGSGTFTLAGSSVDTFSGTTRIEEGRIRARTFSLSNTIVNDAEIELFQPLDDALPLTAYSGSISGAGKLIKSGDGVVWLRGLNTYSGGTVVEEGVLLGNTDSLQGNIETRGFVAFYQTENSIFRDEIFGDGGVLMYGSGVLQLNGSNSYRGGTYFSGTIIAENAANLGAVESDIVFVGGTLRAGAALDLPQRVFVADTGGVIDTAGFDTQFGGGLAGAGALQKIGTGRLTVTGDNPAFSGSLRVRDGQAHLAGSLHGSVEFSAGSEFVAFASPTAVSHLDLIGADSIATINGGKVGVTAAPGDYAPRTRYAVISAEGGVVGQFSGASVDLPGLSLVLSYGPNDVFVNLVRKDVRFDFFATTPLQRDVGDALEQLREDDSEDATRAIRSLEALSAEEMTTALEALAGTSLSGIGRVLGRSQRALDLIVAHRLDYVGAGDGITRGLVPVGGGSPLLAGAALSFGLRRPDVAGSHGAWIRGFGGTGSVEVGSASDDLSLITGGIIAGYDVALLPAATAGVTFSRYKSTFDQDRPVSIVDMDTWQLGTYARWQRQAWAVGASLTYGDHEVDTRRTLPLGFNTAVAAANFDSYSVNGRIEASYRWGTKITAEPYTALQVTHLNQEGYVEEGAGFLGLNVPNRSENSVRSSLGLRLETAIMELASPEVVEIKILSSKAV